MEGTKETWQLNITYNSGAEKGRSGDNRENSVKVYRLFNTIRLCLFPAFEDYSVDI